MSNTGKVTVLWLKRGWLVQHIKAHDHPVAQGSGEHERPKSKKEKYIKQSIIEIGNKLHNMCEEEGAGEYGESQWKMGNRMHNGRGVLTKDNGQDGSQRRAQMILPRTVIA